MATLRTLWVGALTIAVGTLGAPVTAYSAAYEQQDVWRLDVSEPLTYFIAEGSPESGFKEEDRTLAEWALEGVGPADRSPREHGAGPGSVRNHSPILGARRCGSIR